MLYFSSNWAIIYKIGVALNAEFDKLSIDSFDLDRFVEYIIMKSW